MNIFIGSDHGGFELKLHIINCLKLHHNVIDKGCYNKEKCDYPDYALQVCEEVNKNNKSIGILICGTGIGMSIASNKIKNITCALCNDVYSAQMAKQHNNANVIALGAKIVTYELSMDIINTFINSNFDGERHEVRLHKIRMLENHSNFKTILTLFET